MMTMCTVLVVLVVVARPVLRLLSYQSKVRVVSDLSAKSAASDQTVTHVVNGVSADLLVTAVTVIIVAHARRVAKVLRAVASATIANHGVTKIHSWQRLTTRTSVKPRQNIQTR